MRSFFEGTDMQAFWAQLKAVLGEIAFLDEIYEAFGMRPETERRLLLPYDDFLNVHHSNEWGDHRLHWGYVIKTGERTPGSESGAFRITASANVSLFGVAESEKSFELSYDNPERGYVFRATPATIEKFVAMESGNPLVLGPDASCRKISAQEARLLCRHLVYSLLSSTRSRKDHVPHE